MEGTCPVIPLFTDERIEQEVLINLAGMKSRFGSQGSVDQTVRSIKQGIKENVMALRFQSFNPGSQWRYDMADSSALDQVIQAII